MALSPIFKKMLMGKVFSVEKGRIKIFERTDWSLVPSWVVASLLHEIEKQKGEKYLFKFGMECGHFLNKEVIKEAQVITKNNVDIDSDFINLLEFIGFGKVGIQRLEGKKIALINTQKNPVIKHGYRLFGKKSRVCNWFIGIYLAFGDVLGIKNTEFKEVRCTANKSPCCEWEAQVIE